MPPKWARMRGYIVDATSSAFGRIDGGTAGLAPRMAAAQVLATRQTEKRKTKVQVR